MKNTITLALFAFAAAFCVASFLIAQAVGDPFTLYAANRSEKLAIWEKTEGEFCSAAFGSSHVHNGFDPRAFDQTLRKGGFAVGTLNMAVEGGSQGEQYVMAKRFLEIPAKTNTEQRCMVLLEINAGVNFAPRHLTHPRSINIYDQDTLRLIKEFAVPPASLSQRLGRLGFAAFAGLMHYLNVGMLASRIVPPKNDIAMIERQITNDRRGLLVEPPDAKETTEVQKGLESNRSAATVSSAKPIRGNFSLVQLLKSHTGGANKEFVYVVSPMISDVLRSETYPPCLAVKGSVVPILNVAQPKIFPELYQADLWRDVTHLNEKGAEVFSTLLAKQYLKQHATDVAINTCQYL